MSVHFSSRSQNPKSLWTLTKALESKTAPGWEPSLLTKAWKRFLLIACVSEFKCHVDLCQMTFFFKKNKHLGLWTSNNRVGQFAQLFLMDVSYFLLLRFFFLYSDFSHEEQIRDEKKFSLVTIVIKILLVCPQSVADFNTKCPGWRLSPLSSCVFENIMYAEKFLLLNTEIFPFPIFSETPSTQVFLIFPQTGFLPSSMWSFMFWMWRDSERFVTFNACQVSFASEHSLKPFPHGWCKEFLPSVGFHMTP